jgi:small subunit ribosomal protein S20
MVKPMPQHKSCKKRMRTNAKQNERNRQVKSSVKTATKKFRAAGADEAEDLYRTVSSELDLAARKGVIPRQQADRRKSRLARERNRKRGES